MVIKKYSVTMVEESKMICLKLLGMEMTERVGSKGGGWGGRGRGAEGIRIRRDEF